MEPPEYRAWRTCPPAAKASQPELETTQGETPGKREDPRNPHHVGEERAPFY